MYNFLIFLLVTSTLGSSCSNSPLDAEGCITYQSSPSEFSCSYNYYENACVPIQSSEIGCEINLNKKACISQLYSGQQSLAKCYFGTRCRDVTIYQLSNLGCSDRFSKFACVSVKSSNCIWKNEQCVFYNGSPDLVETCELAYENQSVVPSLCAKIKILRCYSADDFQCTQVEDTMLSQLECTQLGLNLNACLALEGYKCIFKDDHCQYFEPTITDGCNLQVNKVGCLAIRNPNSACQWKDHICEEISDIHSNCEEYIDVNPTVCSKSSQCYYSEGESKCKSITNMVKIQCTTPGLSKDACMLVNQSCSFYYGYCTLLQQDDLEQFRCTMQLNKIACLNLTTYYQLCQWNVDHCESININQNDQCHSFVQVNGNVCQSILYDRCTYDQSNKKCVPSSLLENCTTPFLNLIGCVQVTRVTNSCMWNSGKCQNVVVIPFKSKCASMGYANSIACSQIQEDGKGCYFNTASNQCSQFTVDDSLGCLTPGLNRQGCALISKKGEFCQWYQEHCKKIYQRAEMTQYNCLSLQFVNPPTCALIQSERCKFNSKVLSCVPSVNGKVDTCDTLGLNSVGCGAILTESCYYDNTDWTCKKVDLTTDVDGILKTSTCTGNTPTQGVCLGIITYNQSCAWQSRLEKCMTQYVGFNNNCLEFNTVNMNIRLPGTIIQVNSNVCASVEMNYPLNNGYCSYDTVSKDCKLFDSICSDDCCTTIIGINAHVCSRYSNQNQFCYFNNHQRCALLDEVDTSIQSLVDYYFNSNRYKCSQLNSKSCHIPNWSKSQWCYWDGVVCVNVSFQNYPNFQIFTQAPAITNSFLCLAIEAVQSNTNLIKFFQYDDVNLRCHQLTADKAIPCTYKNINVNSCTRLTKDDYCIWNRPDLSCNYIDDLTLITSCTELINEKACDELIQSCVFLHSTDKCDFVREFNINCNHFETLGTVSARTCASITKDGQSCKYDKNTRNCVVHDQEINTCSIGGANAIACYKFTTAKCRWNVSNLQCYEQLDYSTLGCEDNVNKTICVLIMKEACEWNEDLFRCTKFSSLTTVNSNYSYNALACTQLTGNAYIHFQNKCVTPTTFNLACNDYPMSIQACLIYTRGHQCQYDNFKVLATEKCSGFVGTPSTSCSFDVKVSIESCINLPVACYFDKLNYECLPAPTNGKCSDLIDASKYYNIMACISVNPGNTLLGPTQACIDKDTNESCQFEKYCQWDPSLYSCNYLDFAKSNITSTSKIVYVDVTDEFGNTTSEAQTVTTTQCAINNVTYNTCKNTYSKAVCLEIVKAPCYFDYSQGGCMSINQHLVSSCDSANEFGCQMISNSQIACTIDIAPDYVPGCSKKQNLNLCKSQSLLGVDCASMNGQVNASVCASATDHCYFDGTTCSNALTITICDQVGLSKTTCDSLGNDCHFINSQCIYKQEDVILQNCSQVNTLTIGSERLPKICALVTDQPCQFKSGTCTLLTAPISCSTAQNVNLLACVACTGDSALFIDNLCKLQTDPIYFCSKLNKDACLKLSTGLYCTWQDDQCLQLTDVSILTDCTIINLDGCPLVQNHCWKYGGLCSSSIALSTCKDVADYSGNVLACQFSVDSCAWDNETSACISTGTTIYNCGQEGLSKSACLTSTYLDSDIDQHYTCYFKDGCTSNSIGMSCSVSNKYGCIALKDKLCGWNDKDLVCESVSIVWFSNCNSYISSSDISIVSPFVCSSIAGRYCYMKNNMCDDLDINNPPCVQPGLNENACIEKTINTCQFVSNQCTNLTNLDQDCNSSFNKWSCINLLNRKCKFSSICSTYTKTLNSKTSVMENVGPGSSEFFSPLVCQAIDAENTYLSYDITTNKCRDIDVAPPTAICVATGINKLGCLSRTKQLCRYDPDLKQCQLLLNAQINTYSTCDISLNWMSCIKLTVSCKFKNDSCVPLLITDTCTILSTESSKVIETVCSKQVDKPCYYDSDTSQCNIAISNTLSCTQQGLNQLGCIQNTQSDSCEFDINSKVCKMNPLKNRECTYPINEKKCYEVEMDGNFCKFNLTCQQMLTTELSICVKAFKTNALSCSQASDQSCSYNSASQKCIAGQPTDECLLNNSINELGCVSCEVNNRKLKWLDGCLEATTKDLSILTCQDSINIFTCINIDNPTQYCKFTDKCIQYPLEIYSCESIINVNRQEFCELVTDQPCQFDQANHKCKIVTDSITGCPKGLNQLACLQKTTPGLCSFKNFCYGPDDILLCFQALNQNDCLNITTDTCKWVDNECQSVDTTDLFCSDISDQLVSNSVCQLSKVTNTLDACVRDTFFHCKVVQPTICEELTNITACTRMLGIPCIWEESKCQFYLNNQSLDTCVSVNSIGSNRVCLDVKRSGQKCKYLNYHCLNLDPADEGCMENYNQIACLTQTKFQCIWKIENRNVISLGQDAIYQSGFCQTYVEDPVQNCSDNLSYLVCFLVKQKGQFCKWQDNKCISINTSSTTLANVNANACALIESYIAQYDEYLKACKIGEEERTCVTVGLNKLGCLSLENQNCAFDDELKYCYEQQELSEQPINSCQVQNVSPQLCQSILTGKACGFKNGNCVDLSLNSKCGPGINYYGCMALTQYSCIWLNGTCQEYEPYTDCQTVPNNVNQKVCSLVQEDACMWDSLNYKCISPVGGSCDLQGINLIGCSNIDNCLFKGNKCFLSYDNFHCSEIPGGNALVCAAALDNCKYNPINYGCTESTLSDICSTPGLSQSGCDLIPQCIWQEGNCNCKQVLVHFPVCSTINSFKMCSQIDYCYFELVKVNSPKDLTEFLQISNSGVCRQKQCSDIEDLNYCSGTRIANIYCYLSQGVCKSASSCQEIKNYQGNCQQFKFNSIPCNDSYLSCEDLNCEELSLSQCNTFNHYCYYDQQHCKPLICSKMTQNQCVNSNCDWDVEFDVCKTQVPCEQVVDKLTCMSKKYNFNQCAWFGKCVAHGCRSINIQSYSQSCSGTHIGNEICVKLIDESCVSCEEIQDPCVCLNQSQYCTYDNLRKKCQSMSCYDFEESQCPVHCRFTDNICQPFCYSHYNVNQCNQGSECYWDSVDNYCKYDTIIIPDPEVILPKLRSELIFLSGILIILSS